MTEPRQRLPEFVKSPAGRDRRGLHGLKARLRRARLHTVCESARCPNINECFARPTATFMIMGNSCSRGCRFCAVDRGEPAHLDPAEPGEVAEAAHELDLKHVVVTSVTRDDLVDGGASQFAEVIHAVRERLPAATVEVLVPDFQGSEASVRTVMDARPDVFNHNLETVPRLYKKVRPDADYKRSLDLLALVATINIDTAMKSGIMVGLGEDKAEVVEVMADLASAGCDIVTIGQYLQPQKDRLPVARYLRPEEYEEFIAEGERMALAVFAGPLVRSSYMADKFIEGK